MEKGKYSSAELVGFAFHTLAKFDPDFKAWIAGKEYLNKLEPIKRITATRETEQRLRNGFYNYNTETDLIPVEVDADIVVSNYFGASQKPGTQTDVNIELLKVPKGFAGMYFPFQLGDIWVAVVVPGLENLTSFTYDVDDYNEFAKKVALDRYSYTKSISVKMDIILRPLSVDTEAPVMLGGFEMWLMLAEVAQMEIWRPEGRGRKYLWEYRAPGYTPLEELELRHLYVE